MDLRPSSKTFGKWSSIELNGVNLTQLYLPKGIAHGFQTLSQNSIVHYCLTSKYEPNSSYVINPFGDLGIDWPIKQYSISDRDRDGISLSSAVQKYAESLKS